MRAAGAAYFGDISALNSVQLPCGRQLVLSGKQRAVVTAASAPALLVLLRRAALQP